MRAERKLVVVLGPTAVGKSRLALRLAKKYHGVIISADSRQVYRGLNIGTAKATTAERRQVPHYLLDVASPRTQYTVARYVKEVYRIMKKIPSTAAIFLVGGSPFYIQAVLDPTSFSPVPPNPKLRRRLAAKSTSQLMNQLTRLDPHRAATIDPANRRRLIRAIEIASSKKKFAPLISRPFSVLKIGLRLPNSELFKKIDRRVDQRMKAGMLAEVRRLRASGLSWKRLDAFGLEYRFLSKVLRGQMSKDEVVQKLKSAIHDFARRQMTWWKKETDIRWLRNPADAQRLVKSFLNKNRPSA